MASSTNKTKIFKSILFSLLSFSFAFSSVAPALAAAPDAWAQRYSFKVTADPGNTLPPTSTAVQRYNIFIIIDPNIPPDNTAIQRYNINIRPEPSIQLTLDAEDLFTTTDLNIQGQLFNAARVTTVGANWGYDLNMGVSGDINGQTGNDTDLVCQDNTTSKIPSISSPTLGNTLPNSTWGYSLASPSDITSAGVNPEDFVPTTWTPIPLATTTRIAGNVPSDPWTANGDFSDVYYLYFGFLISDPSPACTYKSDTILFTAITKP